MKQLKDLAFKSSNNPQEQIACYVALLESHIETQNHFLETFQQELNLILSELTQEQS
jgi:hypothetical protein